MLEGLTKYWGFYLVAVPDANGVGINDFAEALAQFTEYWEWVTDLRSLDVTRRAAQDEVNSRIASRHLRRVLAACIVVFRLFLQLAIQVDGTLQEKHKRFWLWFQLFGEVPFGGTHPFVRIMNCTRSASDDALDVLIGCLNDILCDVLNDPHFILGLDEAQWASRLYPHSFISSTDAATTRSIIREVAKVFTKLPIKLVVSGTGLSLQELNDTMASGVSKPAPVELFHNLGMFDTWQDVKLFVDRYIPAYIFETNSGRHLQQQMREYLLGR